MRRFTRRWRVGTLFVLILLLAGAAAFLLVTRGERRLTHADFAKITPGMSRAQVEHILGAPRSTRDYGWATFYLYRGDVSQASAWQIQTGLVKFKPSGEVESVVTGEDARWPLLDKIRSLIP
jgi:outer membrane protein assembly factor BamE (lipoprotein component of BamABCDE complex)